MNIKAICEIYEYKTYIDSNWIAWKFLNSKWVGKRCVSSKDGYRYCWLEDVPKEEKVHEYLHGKDADYNEEIYENKRKCNCWLEIDTCYCVEDED